MWADQMIAWCDNGLMAWSVRVEEQELSITSSSDGSIEITGSSNRDIRSAAVQARRTECSSFTGQCKNDAT